MSGVIWAVLDMGGGGRIFLALIRSNIGSKDDFLGIDLTSIQGYLLELDSFGFQIGSSDPSSRLDLGKRRFRSKPDLTWCSGEGDLLFLGLI